MDLNFSPRLYSDCTTEIPFLSLSKYMVQVNAGIEYRQRHLSVVRLLPPSILSKMVLYRVVLELRQS